MAKEPKQASAPKIEFDALAETVVPDPATIPDSVALAGFVGRSAEDGKIRLYVDAGFRNYYEISSSDILHSQQLPATQSPLGGSVVYVRSSAPLRRVQVSTEIEARFLQGPMSNAGAGAAGASSLPEREYGILARNVLYWSFVAALTRPQVAPTFARAIVPSSVWNTPFDMGVRRYM